MKSQISKDFSLKSKLRKLADGGSVQPAMLGSGLVANAGKALGGRASQIEARLAAAEGRAPAPAPVAAPAPEPKTGLRGFFGLADGGEAPHREPVVGTRSPLPSGGGGGLSRDAVAAAQAPVKPAPRPDIVGLPTDYLRNPRAILATRMKSQGLADGGERLGEEYAGAKYQQSQLRDGGHVEGPGGPTDDKVGPVMLSDKEYVLPGDTADAIGRDKLDALRAATHEFKDPEEEAELLEGADDDGDEGMSALADGGSPWSVDGRGNVNTGAPNRSPALRTPPQGALRPVPQPIPQRPPVDITPQGGRSAPAAQMAQEITDVKAKTPFSRAGSALRKAVVGGAAPALAGGAGAYQSFQDNGSGFRDEFGKDMGAESSLGMLAADTARTLGNVGDAATFGVAGRLGRGISAGIQGGSFADGFMGDAPRDQFLERQAASSQTMNPKREAPAGAAPAEGTGRMNRLNEMGVSDAVQNSRANPGSRDVLRSGGASEYQNLGTYGGDSNIYGRASDPAKPGRINDFAGVGTGDSAAGRSGVRSALRPQAAQTAQPDGPTSNARAINAEYDKLLSNGKGQNTVRGADWSQRHGASVARDRASALRDDAQTLGTARGQDMTAATSRDNAALAADSQLRDRLSREGVAAAEIHGRASAAQAKAVSDAQATYAASEEKGNERYNKALDSMFTVDGPDGKQTVDKAMQEQFRNYIQSSDLQVGGKKFSAMSPQEQMANMQEALQQFQIGNAVNETAASGSWLANTGGVTNSFNPVTGVGEAELTDWARGNMPFLDYASAKISPFTTNRVVRTQSGQSALYDDVVNDGNGARNLDRERAIKSSLRGN